MSRKTFCVLEQGRSVGDPLTLRHESMFQTPFSDFYRLNWEAEADPHAFVLSPGIVWSEGRALLYEKVPKLYDFYIFIDDDIEFADGQADVALTIKHLLEHYQPLTGTLFDRQRFTDPARFNFLGSLDLSACLARPAFPVAGYDQQVQIFSSSFADVMFPAPYHGAGMSMWYSQWLCFKQFPAKQLCFTGVEVANMRKEVHANERRLQHIPGVDLVALFDDDTTVWQFDRNLATILADNHEAFMLEPDRNPVVYTLDILAEVYDIENPFFRERSAVVADPVDYRRRVSERLSRLVTDTKRHVAINRETLRKQGK